MILTAHLLLWLYLLSLGTLLIFLLAFANVFLDYYVITLELLMLLDLIKFLLVSKVDLRYQSIFDIDYDCLEAAIHLVLLDLFLQFLEVGEFKHELFEVARLPDLLQFYIHHLASHHEDSLLALQVQVIIQLQTLQPVPTI